jgi:hypothetical protein
MKDDARESSAFSNGCFQSQFFQTGLRLWPKIDSALHKIMKETVEPKIQDPQLQLSTASGNLAATADRMLPPSRGQTSFCPEGFDLQKVHAGENNTQRGADHNLGCALFERRYRSSRIGALDCDIDY